MSLRRARHAFITCVGSLCKQASTRAYPLRETRRSWANGHPRADAAPPQTRPHQRSSHSTTRCAADGLGPHTPRDIPIRNIYPMVHIWIWLGRLRATVGEVQHLSQHRDARPGLPCRVKYAHNHEVKELEKLAAAHAIRKACPGTIRADPQLLLPYRSRDVRGHHSCIPALPCLSPKLR